MVRWGRVVRTCSSDTGITRSGSPASVLPRRNPLIAIKDSAEPDSGNVYFGDPVYGTLEYMDAFMFAENNFLDTNLSASGSATVTVHGNMTAGNQVKIDRDFNGAHSKLTVDFDERIVNSSISLPGLPTATAGVAGWTMGSWREVAVP